MRSNTERIFIALVATTLAWFVGVMMAFAIGRLVPERIDLENDEEVLQLQQEMREKGSLTEEDFRRTERLFKSKSRAKAEVDSLQAFLAKAQDRALPVAWIPWALLGFFALRNSQRAMGRRICSIRVYYYGEPFARCMRRLRFGCDLRICFQTPASAQACEQCALTRRSTGPVAGGA